MMTNFKLLVDCIKGRELRSFSITMHSCDHCTCGRLSVPMPGAATQAMILVVITSNA